jgi:hypothetical protein
MLNKKETKVICKREFEIISVLQTSKFIDKAILKDSLVL